MAGIELNNILFSYPNSEFRFNVDQLHIAKGETVAVIGPSGSGKTTFLNLVAGILTPNSGDLKIHGVSVSSMSKSGTRDFRLNEIGFVFQDFKLVPHLNCLDNILLPVHFSRQKTPDKSEEGYELLQHVQLGDKAKKLPSELSQGEQQRIAICRALINSPNLLIADEPTGNLDGENKKLILDLLISKAKALKATLIAVTHDMSLTASFDRVIDFKTFLSNS